MLTTSLRAATALFLSASLLPFVPSALSAQDSAEAFSASVANARRYASAGLTLEALERLEGYLNGPHGDAALAESSRIRFESKDYGGAVEGYRQLLQRLPGTLTVQRNLLLALYRNYQDDEARELLKTMGAAANTDLRARTVRGLLAARAGDPATAQGHLQAAALLDNRDPEAHYELGLFFLTQGDPAAAISSLQEALRRDPSYTQAYYNLGLAWTRAGDPAKGGTFLSRARALNAEVNERRTRYIRAVALAKRAQEAMDRGDGLAAVEDLERALELHPEEPNLRGLLARARRIAENGSR